VSQALLLTVNGTGVPDPYGPGFSADLGRALGVINPWQAIANKLDGLLAPKSALMWQPIGYPAAVFPMAPSVEAGRQELVRQIAMRPVGTPLFLSGYSQGAISVAVCWTRDILATNGSLHNRLPDVRGLIQFGDPTRSPGICNGNRVAGVPMPGKIDGLVTGGIAGPGDLTPAQTPDFYLSCSMPNDLYTNCPTGPDPWRAESHVGLVTTNIYDIVEQPTFRDVISIARDFFMPVATVEALINAIMFFGAGQNAGHWQYEQFIPALCDWILSRI
jgi:hypothetical protein